MLGVVVHSPQRAPPQPVRRESEGIIPGGLARFWAGSERVSPAPTHTLRLLGVVVSIQVWTRTMAVTKELLQMDLYALLGIEEKAADKEVRT
jgi:hypothetical protein